MNFTAGGFLTSKGYLASPKEFLNVLRGGLAHTKGKELLPEAWTLGAGACLLLHYALVGTTSNTMCDNTLLTAVFSFGVGFRMAL